MTSSDENLKLRLILLVEDSPGDARLTIEAFKEGSIPVSLAVVEDGQEALSYLRRVGKYSSTARPDLILLDLNLPKVDGREVLAQVKADPELKSIPVIILSTSQAPTDVSYCYKHHSNCFISKPVEVDKFSQIVGLIESFWLNAVRLPEMV